MSSSWYPFLHLQEVVPELKPLQGDEKEINQQLKDVLVLSVDTLCQNVSWFDTLSSHQQLCWGVVATCSSKIPVSDNCHWVKTYHYAIAQLGKIFTAYCNAHKHLGSSCILSQHFPVDISGTASNAVTRYFQWVRKAQDMLMMWQKKFERYDVDYNDILMYTNDHACIDNISRLLCAHTLLVDRQDVDTVKDQFTAHFDQLCSYLLRYIPGHPEARWCTLPVLLTDYGVSLPFHLQDTISKHVIFPGEQKPLVGELLHSSILVTTNSQFHVGQDTFLKLTKAFTLKSLLQLVQDIKDLLQDVSKEHMDMLVFFHLQQSEMFKKYLLKQLKKEATKAAAVSLEMSTVSPFFTSLPTPQLTFLLQQPQQQEQQDSATLKMLERALEVVHNLIHRLAEGAVTYSDIVAGGALKLESLNIKGELEIFTQYANQTGLTNTEGLDGIQSMLDLFQFAHHIDMINSVCKQYQLHGCLNDPTLNELMETVKGLTSEDVRAKLTPMDALKKVWCVCVCVCVCVCACK